MGGYDTGGPHRLLRFAVLFLVGWAAGEMTWAVGRWAGYSGPPLIVGSFVFGGAAGAGAAAIAARWFFGERRG